jgi:hypothetical protein
MERENSWSIMPIGLSYFTALVLFVTLSGVLRGNPRAPWFLVDPWVSNRRANAEVPRKRKVRRRLL